MKLLLSFLMALSLSPLFAHADGIVIGPRPLAPIYECMVVVAAQGIAGDDGTFHFVTNNAGEHGGQAQSFKIGQHEVLASVDKQWLSIVWNRGGKTVASAEFVVGPEDRPAFKVGLLHDPAGDDQVSVSCNRVTQ